MNHFLDNLEKISENSVPCFLPFLKSLCYIFFFIWILWAMKRHEKFVSSGIFFKEKFLEFFVEIFFSIFFQKFFNFFFFFFLNFQEKKKSEKSFLFPSDFNFSKKLERRKSLADVEIEILTTLQKSFLGGILT